jgi:hypothetical protein
MVVLFALPQEARPWILLQEVTWIFLQVEVIREAT